jgi:hypothetical protein
MYNVLAAIPQKHRRNVVYYDMNGSMHANRPELLPEKLSGGTTEATEAPAEQVAATAAATFPSCNPLASPQPVGGCTGVLYQHVGQTGHGYFSSTINIPCASTLLDTADYNLYQANVYITVYYSSSESLEMGIAFYPNMTSPSSPPVSVQPYFSETHGGIVTASPNANAHLACDQSGLQLETWIAQTAKGAPALGVMDIQGAFTSINGSVNPCGAGVTTPCNEELVTAKAINTNNPDLTQTCASCKVEWTTAIAVPAGGSQLLANSYFGISENTTPNCQPTFSWGSVTQGSYAGYGPNATLSTAPWTSTTVKMYPPNAVNQRYIALSPEGGLTNQLIGINEDQTSGCIPIHFN